MFDDARSATFGPRVASDGIVPRLAGTDTDRFFHVGYEDFPIPDPARLGGGDNSLNCLFYHAVAQHNLKFHLGQEVDDVFRATIEFRMALLPAEALGLGDGDALEADLLQRVLHLIEFEGFNNCLDLLHACSGLPRTQKKERSADPARLLTVCEGAKAHPMPTPRLNI